MTRIRFCVALLALVSLGQLRAEEKNQLSADVEKILRTAKTFELFSLNPKFLPPPKNDEAGTRFHNYEILGSTVVKDKSTRSKLIEAMKKGIAANDGTVAGCFNPRHGIRASAGKKSVDLVICFECYQIAIYQDGKRSSVLVTGLPQPTFDKVLKTAKVLLPGQDD